MADKELKAIEAQPNAAWHITVWSVQTDKRLKKPVGPRSLHYVAVHFGLSVHRPQKEKKTKKRRRTEMVENYNYKKCVIII